MVLVFPLLAASLVLSASPDKADSKGPFTSLLPSFIDDSQDSDDTDSRGAKRRKRTRSKATVLAGYRGALPSRGTGDGCPTDMVLIDRSYCIDPYEASLVQVASGGSETAWPYFEVVPADVVVRAVSLPDVFPQGYVSGLQARAACERSGKRLCAPDEWRNACMGPQRTLFPYGNQREPGRCNDNGRSSMHLLNPALDDKPAHRWMWGAGGNMIDPRLNQMAGTLTRTGEREGCTNEYGVYDMVGNLHEWVEDPNGTFQGGYYLDTHANGDGCTYRTTAHPMSHYDYSTGFRCCADATAL